jgi:lysophospholipase L1-like esterase
MKIANRLTFPRRRFVFLLTAFCISSSPVWAADTNAPVAAGKAIRVACVGDSITFGAGINDRQHDSYPAVLGGLLGAGWDVRNFGVNSTTLLHKGDRPYIKTKAHNDALAFAPDDVVIMLGTNDSKHRGDGSLEADKAINNWQYQADFVPDYEALIAEFRKANPNVKVYACLPTPCLPGRWGINGKTIHDDMIPLIRQAAKDENASIIDLNSALGEKRELLLPDTVHPNDAGAKLMAETVYQSLTGKTTPASAQ